MITPQEGFFLVHRQYYAVKLSLCSAGLGAGKLSLLEFADLAARHDFAGIDFGIGSAIRLAEEQGGMNAVKDALAQKGVAPAVFGLDVEWRKDEETFQSGLASLPEKAKAASALGATRCCTWMLPATNENASVYGARVARRFRAVAEIFGEHGVALGLEWVGPHHLRVGGENATGANPFIYTMAETLALIAEIGLPNVGLLVDSYHCYTTEIGGTEVGTLTDTQIVHVHINDAAKGVGVAGAKDGQRVLPGAGEIDLADFLSGLRTASYTGYIACEVLSPHLLGETPEAATAAMRAALRSVGL